MGNWEVAHNAMGSGQIYSQGAKLVNESIETERIFDTPIWNEVVTQTGENGKTVHLFGLLSDGNVHSHIRQLFKILDGVAKSGVKRIRVHPLLDGRDVAPDSGLEYIDQLEEKLGKLRTSLDIDAQSDRVEANACLRSMNMNPIGISSNTGLGCHGPPGIIEKVTLLPNIQVILGLPE